MDDHLQKPIRLSIPVICTLWYVDDTRWSCLVDCESDIPMWAFFVSIVFQIDLVTTHTHYSEQLDREPVVKYRKVILNFGT